MRIFVIGFMGAGKSYWAPIWANKLHTKFVDLDQYIEESFGKSVMDIFDHEGEIHFRHLEKKVLETLVEEKDIIIACGGGTPCFFNNMQWMNDHGKTIYLKATGEQIYSRICGELHKRPLLKHLNDEELKVFIEDKLKEREPFYQQASITIDVNELNENSLESIINT